MHRPLATDPTETICSRNLASHRRQTPQHEVCGACARLGACGAGSGSELQPDEKQQSRVDGQVCPSTLLVMVRPPARSPYETSTNRHGTRVGPSPHLHVPMNCRRAKPAAIGAGFVRLASSRDRFRPAGACGSNVRRAFVHPIDSQIRWGRRKTPAREGACGRRPVAGACERAPVAARGGASGALNGPQWRKRLLLHDQPAGTSETGGKVAGQEAGHLRCRSGARGATNESYPFSSSTVRGPRRTRHLCRCGAPGRSGRAAAAEHPQGAPASPRYRSALGPAAARPGAAEPAPLPPQGPRRPPRVRKSEVRGDFFRFFELLGSISGSRGAVPAPSNYEQITQLCSDLRFSEIASQHGLRRALRNLKKTKKIATKPASADASPAERRKNEVCSLDGESARR